MLVKQEGEKVQAENIPKDVWFSILSFTVNFNFLPLALTNKYFLSLYQSAYADWQLTFRSHFPNPIHKIKPKGPSWNAQFLQLSAKEYQREAKKPSL